MQKIIYGIGICLFALSTIGYTQENDIVNKGIYIRVLGMYNNFAYRFTSSGITNPEVKFSADITGGFGLGGTIGYRGHGVGLVDGSIDVSYIHSSHRIEYHYLPISLITLWPNMPNVKEPTENNTISLNCLSIDLNIFFFTKSPLQPFLTFGFEFLLNAVSIRAIPFAYAIDNKPTTSPDIPYHYDRSFTGYGFHGGIGVAYYLFPQLTLNGTINLNNRRFDMEHLLWGDDGFSSLNIDSGCSFSLYF